MNGWGSFLKDVVCYTLYTMCRTPLTCLGSMCVLLNIDKMREMPLSFCPEEIISINKLTSMKKRSTSILLSCDNKSELVKS